jgi:hypothetical protein
MRKLFQFATVVALATGVFATPAMADSFSLAFSSGGHGHSPGWHDNWHDRGRHRGYYNYHAPRYGYFTSVYRSYPAPQVVYVEPPVQQVIFANNAPSYQNDNGQYCREYQALVYVGGQRQNGYGTACYMPDGSWKVVD